MGQKKHNKENDEDGHNLIALLTDYELNQLIFKLQIGDHSPMVGKTAMELDLHRRYGVTLLEERHRNKLLGSVVQSPVRPDTIFQPGDVLYAMGTREHLNEMAQIFNLTLFAEEMREDHAKLDFYDLGLSEILISPESKLVNLTVQEAGFRQRNNVNVLAIKRSQQCIVEDIQSQTIHAGDMMLVHGAWNDIKKMKTNLREWIIIGDPAEELENVALDHKAPLAAGIMLSMVLLMVFADQIGIPPVTTVVVAGLLMVLLGCVRSVDTAYKMIGWESIVLIAAMMSMSSALSSTGISDFIATNVVHGLKEQGPWAVLIGVYVVTSVLSTFISNSATAILVAPIAWSAAQQLGVSPTPFMMGAAIAASAVFALPISPPPQCHGHECWSLHLYGLCEGRSAPPNSDGHCSYFAHPTAIPLLNKREKKLPPLPTHDQHSQHKSSAPQSEDLCCECHFPSLLCPFLRCEMRNFAPVAGDQLSPLQVEEAALKREAGENPAQTRCCKSYYFALVMHH